MGFLQREEVHCHRAAANRPGAVDGKAVWWKVRAQPGVDLVQSLAETFWRHSEFEPDREGIVIALGAGCAAAVHRRVLASFERPKNGAANGGIAGGIFSQRVAGKPQN